MTTNIQEFTEKLDAITAYIAKFCSNEYQLKLLTLNALSKEFPEFAGTLFKPLEEQIEDDHYNTETNKAKSMIMNCLRLDQGMRELLNQVLINKGVKIGSGWQEEIEILDFVKESVEFCVGLATKRIINDENMNYDHKVSQGKNWYEAAQVLKLIKSTIPSSDFPVYCKRKFGWSKRHCERLIASSVVIDNLKSAGLIENKIPNSSLLNPIASLNPSQQLTVWKLAQQYDKITVHLIIQLKYDVMARSVDKAQLLDKVIDDFSLEQLVDIIGREQTA